MKFIKRIKKNIFPLLLLAISIVACATNYTPHTFLIGWDTLHPEFDFWLNFKRVFFGVWREEQGVGALAVHAHMSDLPRIVLLYLLSFAFPLDTLRYITIFIPLITGPLGVYFFLRKLVYNRANSTRAEIASFLGGLFYLLNLGTVQQFYVPFEMFTTLYGVLPWLLFYATRYLSTDGKKNLLIFSFITLLGAPMAYAPTLWYVYFGSLGLFCLGFLVTHPNKVDLIKRSFLLALATISVNAFWLFPHLYQLVTYSSNVPTAKINEMFSGQAFAHDEKYADIFNAAVLKGFLFDWQEMTKDGFSKLLDVWSHHIGSFYVWPIGILLGASVFYGAFVSSKTTWRFRIPLLFIFLFTFAFIIHGQWPLSLVFDAVRDKVSLFKEGLRFPWTKFSLFVVFILSVYFSQATFSLMKSFKANYSKWVFGLIVSSFLIIWGLPIFQGELINKELRIDVPQQYFELYKWFNTQPSSQRIGLFPAAGYWGWDYYKWGFQGAGFLWFGLPQSLLVRDFDRWTSYNENFYWEISYAIDKGDRAQVESVLNKYQVDILIIDDSIINPAFPRYQLDKLREIVNSSPDFQLEKEFTNIQVYKFNTLAPENNFVFLGSNLPVVNSNYKWNNNDVLYQTYSNYIENSSDKNYYYYPFASLFTGKNQEDREIEITQEGDQIIVTKKLPEELKSLTYEALNIPDENLLWVDPTDLGNTKQFTKTVVVKDGIIKVIIPKLGGYYGGEIDAAHNQYIKDSFALAIRNCNDKNIPNVKNETITSEEKTFLRLTAQDATNCSAAFSFPNLSHKLSYLISVESRNKSGRSALFWVENLDLKKSDLETYLPNNKDWETSYFIQPPMKSDGLGYMFHFDNTSIGSEKAINDLGAISITPFPYQFLANLAITVGQPNQNSQLISLNVQHPNASYYYIPRVTTQNNGTVILSQGYNEGWKMYKGKVYIPFISQEVGTHTIVNNWENGWIMPNNYNGDVTILYWPQYLEYLGFIASGGFLIGIIVWKGKNGKKIS